MRAQSQRPAVRHATEQRARARVPARRQLEAVAHARRHLLLSRPRLRVLALGGGPGFEGVALAALARFVGSSVEIELVVADAESAWEATAAAVHRAL
eukprot:4284554-Prymnesium_polylepis.1